jgi:hypothetical protein
MAFQNISLIISPGQSFVYGQIVQVIHDLDNYMFGQVLEYNDFTGYLLFTPSSVYGSGAYDSWTVVPSGSAGQATLYQGTSQTVIPVPSTTTTTTTIYYPTNYYYILTKYNCPGCTIAESFLKGRSSIYLVTGYFYNIGDGFVYKVTGPTTSDLYDVNLDGAASGGSLCENTCGI